MIQTKADSMMEAVTNTVIGLVISTIANHIVLPLVLGVHMSIGQNVVISLIFTVISIVRSYCLRRAFNGRSAWRAMRDWYQ